MNHVYATKTLLVPTMTVLTVVLVIEVSPEMERLVKVLYVSPRVITVVFLVMRMKYGLIEAPSQADVRSHSIEL